MSTAVLLTLEEFLARPEREDSQREELIEGELILSPGAKVSHAEIVERLRERLQPLKEQGFAVSNDFACVLPSSSVPNPDLAAVRRERWDEAVRTDDWLLEAPELVVEVSSPSNRKLHHKAALYIEHGAEQVWVVYPRRRTVSIFTVDGTAEARIGEALEFHGVSVPVAEIFPA